MHHNPRNACTTGPAYAVKEVNIQRQMKAPSRQLDGASHFQSELVSNPRMAVDFIIAPPRMAYYMEYSTRIYSVYMKYVAPEDIVVYSIDEVFMDVTSYLNTYKLTASELARTIIQDVLETTGMFTMGDVALCSVRDEDKLYKLFGKNAELLIDHAWGWEPCTIEAIKAYKPSTNSLGSGQVLHCPYDFEKAKLIVREMTDLLVLDLVDKGLVTDQLVLTVGYDIENLTDPKRRSAYKGAVTTDHYGRRIPKHAHGTANLGRQASSTRLIIDAVMDLYDRIVDKNLLVRRLNITANHVVPESSVAKEAVPEQLDLFTDYAALEKQREEENAALEREKKMQQAVLTIKKKFGKNAILKGMNLQEGATTKDRNEQIGGHKA